MPDSQSPEQRSAEVKLAVVAETLVFSENGAEYILPEREVVSRAVKAWRDVCLNSQQSAEKPSKGELKVTAKAVL